VLDFGLLFVRLGYAALLFGYHGWGRLLQVYNYAYLNQPWPFVGVVQKLGFPLPPAFALVSALSEAVGTILIALGIFTRPAAAMISISMAVATYSKVSKNESFELPALYLLGGIAIAAAGAGRFSLDSVAPGLFRGGKQKRRPAAASWGGVRS
jgi:putative oxidoreductase